MTAEREAMTLEDVRTDLVALEHDCHVSALTLGKEGLRAMCIEAQKRLHKLLPAIAHLSRAAEPVANRVHVVCRWQGNVCEFIEVEDDSGHSVSIPWTYGKDGYSELILYTHPPEPARDAKGDDRILWGIVANAGRLSDARKPRWAHVSDATGLGSTRSAELCRRFGFDPDEERRGDAAMQANSYAKESDDV